MAQKFGNFRLVKEGFLDGRWDGLVVGRLVLAGLGPVEVCLEGAMTGEIAGKVIGFTNRQFVDDPRASDILSDVEVPQIGKVSLISFDPHPLLAPHPYIEWFSRRQQHYRIELDSSDAWIVSDNQVQRYDQDSQAIHHRLVPLLCSTSSPTSLDSPDQEWF